MVYSPSLTSLCILLCVYNSVYQYPYIGTFVPSEYEKVLHIVSLIHCCCCCCCFCCLLYVYLTQDFTRIEIWEKEILTVNLHQFANSKDNFGLEVEPLYADDGCELLLSALVVDVIHGSPAYQEGVSVCVGVCMCVYVCVCTCMYCMYMLYSICTVIVLLLCVRTYMCGVHNIRSTSQYILRYNCWR